MALIRLLILFLAILPGLALADDSGRGVYPDRSNIENGLQIANGAIIKRFLTATMAYDIPNLTANSGTNFTMTVTGAQLGDAVFLGLPSGLTAVGGLVFNGFVSAADTINIRVRNTSSTAKDLGNNTFRAVVVGF